MLLTFSHFQIGAFTAELAGGAQLLLFSAERAMGEAGRTEIPQRSPHFLSDTLTPGPETLQPHPQICLCDPRQANIVMPREDRLWSSGDTNLRRIAMACGASFINKTVCELISYIRYYV